MNHAKVIGHARSTVKHPSFEGQRLVVTQPLDMKNECDGPPLIAVDPLGSRVGDMVMICADGNAAREVLNNKNTPARWVITGLIDPKKD
ncbi:EutN/CcmL family microcompartment protein [Calycomorphotria hydatis]|uniref:Carbon dioxide concentrating mechanism protein CcmL n=1 Tax=Calycomorphotria hydatis TaxID=2528027 RepID=A0A517T3F3_9PLAN|nr:EutN/CcmL family microcompartment protein [Calycomorphotria hydatis]QDT62908.1 Carbon dioxide concentrating mechanism protein CcmL [Calycomorphotria hydatis]